MRVTLCFLLLLPISAWAQSAPNEIPLFEGVQKTEQQLAADKRFIAEAEKVRGGKPSAIEQLISLGWKEIQNNSPKTAIKRFNQAYLLTADDYRVYWGLGAAAGMLGETARSERLFRKALSFDPTDVPFIVDAGMALQRSALKNARQKGDEPQFKLLEAKKLYQYAVNLEPNQALPHARLAMVALIEGNCAQALKEKAIAQENGGEGLDPAFVADLAARCQSGDARR